MQRITIQKIVECTAEHFDLPVIDILSQRRQRELVNARYVVMFLAQKLTAHSFPAIGKHLGGRDHTTVMAGVDKISERLAEGDKAIAGAIEDIHKRLVPAALSDGAQDEKTNTLNCQADKADAVGELALLKAADLLTGAIEGIHKRVMSAALSDGSCGKKTESLNCHTDKPDAAGELELLKAAARNFGRAYTGNVNSQRYAREALEKAALKFCDQEHRNEKYKFTSQAKRLISKTPHTKENRNATTH